MARLILDEDFAHRVGHELRRLGHDVLFPSEVGRAGRTIPDDQALAFAASLGRAMLTLNRWDFVRLHRANDDHAGIVVCTHDPDFTSLAARIHRAVKTPLPWPANWSA